MNSTDKVALIGANGTGKTTLLREIFQNNLSSIEVNEDTKMAYLSQLQGEMLHESNTILEEFFDVGFKSYEEIASYLLNYGFEGEILSQKIGALSGGEKTYFSWLRSLPVKQTCCCLMNRQVIWIPIHRSHWKKQLKAIKVQF
jgi:ATPase subunit of ABC transporter with duplicated ATPase domains